MNEENELIDDESTDLTVPLTPMFTVTPDQIKDFQKNLSTLKEAILKQGVDYKSIMISNQPKIIFYRTGWEKIAFFFRISTEILEKNYREYERQAIKITRDPNTDKVVKKEPMFDKDKNPIMQKHYAYEITVRAFCGNISNDALGACSSDESKTFNHPLHDIFATAHTRAKGRAICAMIGAGLSFEEVASIKQAEKRKKTQDSSKKRIVTR